MIALPREVVYICYAVDETCDANGDLQEILVPTGDRIHVPEGDLLSNVAEQLADQIGARRVSPGRYVFYPESQLIELELVAGARVKRIGTQVYVHTVGGTDRPVAQPSAIVAAVKQYTDAHPGDDIGPRHGGLQDQPVWAAFQAAQQAPTITVLDKPLSEDQPCPLQDHAPCDRNGPYCLPF